MFIKLKKSNLIKKIRTTLRVIIILGVLMSTILSLINIAFVGWQLNISTGRMIIYILLLSSNVFLLIDYISIYFEKDE